MKKKIVDFYIKWYWRILIASFCTIDLSVTLLSLHRNSCIASSNNVTIRTPKYKTKILKFRYNSKKPPHKTFTPATFSQTSENSSRDSLQRSIAKIRERRATKRRAERISAADEGAPERGYWGRTWGGGGRVVAVFADSPRKPTTKSEMNEEVTQCNVCRGRRGGLGIANPRCFSLVRGPPLLPRTLDSKPFNSGRGEKGRKSGEKRADKRAVEKKQVVLKRALMRG